MSELHAFQQHLSASRRVLALVGAGMSAPSGLPTFRGSMSSLWEGYDASELATPEAFDVDPKLVWQFYAAQRQRALAARPNAAHYALARLAKRLKPPRFLTITQNTDGLSERAGHPYTSLIHLQGDLFTVRCTGGACAYTTQNLDPDLGVHEVPLCPRCNANLRPGIVWFGEPMPYSAIVQANSAIESEEVDLLLCIGISAEVWPAAGYIDEVEARGGKIAVFNPDRSKKREGWFFEGGAEHTLPLALEPLIGEVKNEEDDSMDDEMSDLSDFSDASL